MKTPNKFRIATAAHHLQKFSFSPKHRTTIDWMQLQPVFYRHLIPNQKIDIDVHAMARLASMPVPTFGDGNLHLRAFFVPYRQVCPYFDHFITDSVYTPHNLSSSGIPSGVPYFKNNDFMQAFLNDNQNRFVVAPSQGETPDIVYGLELNGAMTYGDFKLTPLGRQVLKILNALGYEFQWNGADETKYNALALLSFLHIYLDEFWPSAYMNSPVRNTLESYLKLDSSLSGAALGYQDLSIIFTIIPYVCYDSDYFTSAFDNPLGPNSGNFSSFSFVDNTNDYGTYDGSRFSIDSSNNGTPVVSNTIGTSATQRVSSITQFALDQLKALSDYMRRNQLAGSRMLERFLARFGVKPNPLLDGRCINVGHAMIPLIVSDQFSTAETQDAHIGDYAGKGFIRELGDTNPHFSFETNDEYGIFIVTASLVPSIGYVQGIDRHNLEINKMDFYNPENDALGCQAISAAELLCEMDAQDVSGASNVQKVFGFNPRDAHRKVGKDWLTGDYRYASLNAAGDTSNAWHTFRLFSGYSFGRDVDNMVHSLDFVQGKDAVQYDRIFFNTTNSADHFYLDCCYLVDTYAPMKALYDMYDFKDDEHQKEVTVDNSQSN